MENYNLSKNVHYVYIHFDPRDGVVRYVGMGKLGRAWATDSRKDHHKAWINELAIAGYNPGDFVKIIHSRLCEQEARLLEGKEIQKYAGTQLFNYNGFSITDDPTNKWGISSTCAECDYVSNYKPPEPMFKFQHHHLVKFAEVKGVSLDTLIDRKFEMFLAYSLKYPIRTIAFGLKLVSCLQEDVEKVENKIRSQCEEFRKFVEVINRSGFNCE